MRRRGDHIVVHAQPAAEAAVGHVGGGRGCCRRSRGSGARGALQLGGAAARRMSPRDQRPVGQVQRAGHGNDYHENRKVSSNVCNSNGFHNEYDMIYGAIAKPERLRWKISKHDRAQR